MCVYSTECLCGKCSVRAWHWHCPVCMPGPTREWRSGVAAYVGGVSPQPSRSPGGRHIARRVTGGPGKRIQRGTWHKPPAICCLFVSPNLTASMPSLMTVHLHNIVAGVPVIMHWDVYGTALKFGHTHSFKCFSLVFTI